MISVSTVTNISYNFPSGLEKMPTQTADCWVYLYQCMCTCVQVLICFNYCFHLYCNLSCSSALVVLCFTATLSRATAMARYPANSPLHLSLNRGDIIEIKSKSAGSKPELWGGEVCSCFPAWNTHTVTHTHKSAFGLVMWSYMYIYIYIYTIVTKKKHYCFVI